MSSSANCQWDPLEWHLNATLLGFPADPVERKERHSKSNRLCLWPWKEKEIFFMNVFKHVSNSTMLPDRVEVSSLLIVNERLLPSHGYMLICCTWPDGGRGWILPHTHRMLSFFDLLSPVRMQPGYVGYVSSIDHWHNPILNAQLTARANKNMSTLILTAATNDVNKYQWDLFSTAGTVF